MDTPDPLEQLRSVSDQIVAGVEAALPHWAGREVGRILDAWNRLDPVATASARDRARACGNDVAARVGGELRALLARDPAEQAATPLQVVRSATREPTALLVDLGVPEVVRDSFDERANPADVYDLVPRTLADLGNPDLGPLLLAWGVAKARVLTARRAPDE